MNDWIEIGRTGKTHGLKGELKLSIDEFFLEDFMGTEVIFLEKKGRKTPYFVESVRGENQLLLKLEEIDTLEQAMLLTNLPVFLREEDISEIPDEEDDGLAFSVLTGFKILDPAGNLIGTIEAVEEYPHQEMAVVRYQGREVLIPMAERLIVEVREKTREVVMDLPEGLLEI